MAEKLGDSALSAAFSWTDAPEGADYWIEADNAYQKWYNSDDRPRRKVLPVALYAVSAASILSYILIAFHDKTPTSTVLQWLGFSLLALTGLSLYFSACCEK